jgi:hypothetical protein
MGRDWTFLGPLGPLRGAIVGSLVATTLAWVSSSAAAPNASDSPVSRVSVLLGGVSYVDDDMELTYGTTMISGLRWAIALGENSDFFAGFHYGSDSGDPYYSEPDMSVDDSARLRTFPIEFGARAYTSHHPSRKFYLGFAVQYLWVEEKIPGAVGGDTSENPSYSGWGWGVRVLAGPEWRFMDGKLAVGAEFSVGTRYVYVKLEEHRRIADLTGIASRGYLSFGL